MPTEKTVSETEAAVKNETRVEPVLPCYRRVAAGLVAAGTSTPQKCTDQDREQAPPTAVGEHSRWVHRPQPEEMQRVMADECGSATADHVDHITLTKHM